MMRLKPWYNYWMPKYKSNEPNYFDAETFDWGKKILANRESIKKELLHVIEKRKGQLFSYYSPAVSMDGSKWHTLAFKTWGIDVVSNLAECPEIDKIIKEIPQLVSASVNILMPNSELQLHQGDSNSFYRCHLGIEIPCGLPELGFEVEGEQKAWSKDDLVIFLDAKEHRAWNNTSSRRIIFLFDVIKDEYIDQQKNICFNVRSFLMLQWIGGKYPRFLKWNKKLQRVVFYKIKLLLRIIYPYQKRKGVIIKHS